MENKDIVGDILLRFASRNSTLEELENYVSSVLADLYKAKEMIQSERAAHERSGKQAKKTEKSNYR